MSFFQGTRIPLSEKTFTNLHLAQLYDEHAQSFMGLVYRRFVARIAGINPAGKRVLDVGTGSGLLAIELAKVHPDWQITGVDISDHMLDLARQNAAHKNLDNKIDFRQASAEELPFVDGQFALVTSNASLHLWTNPFKVFREIVRVTSPGGYCLVWDNLRLTVFSPVLNLIGRAMGMNTSQRRLWMQAMHSSYTIGEVKAIMRESSVKDARIFIDPRILYLGIEWGGEVEKT